MGGARVYTNPERELPSFSYLQGMTVIEAKSFGTVTLGHEGSRVQKEGGDNIAWSFLSSL